MGYICDLSLHSFLNSHGFDASKDELIGAIRRIDSSGNSLIDFDEFRNGFKPIIVRMEDVVLDSTEKQSRDLRKTAEEDQ